MPDSLACVSFRMVVARHSENFSRGLKYFRLFFVALYGKRTNLHSSCLLHDPVVCFKIPGQNPQPI